MLILISSLILFIAALALIILRLARPNARYAWLITIGSALLALISVIFWLAQMPSTLLLMAWQPGALFTTPIMFRADALSWPYALSLCALTLSILLTAVARPVFTNSFGWAGTLALGGLGLLAVTAANPLTLLLVWAALDVTELITQLRSVDGPAASEKVVISFSTRALGIGALLWANIVSIAGGSALDFTSFSPDAGLWLIAAAGLRLGVLPLHLPYSAESTLRRGFGTSLRLISAASSLVLLSHVPAGSLDTIFTPLLIAFAGVVAIYGAWMWLRAPDELSGRPYWILAGAALSIIAALNGNPLGATAWGCALVLAGAALFLSSIHNVWLNRALLVGAFSLSSLPFSLTASAWNGHFDLFTPFVIATQAALIAGYIRHALRPGVRESLEAQPNWTRTVYPAGIALLIVVQLFLGFVGWDGALQFGTPTFAGAAAIGALALVWASPRFRVLNPIRAHWAGPIPSNLTSMSDVLWAGYRGFGRISQTLNSVLEGDGGIMWTLLFLALFVSLMIQGSP